MSDELKGLPLFFQRCVRRMKKGEAEYGNLSFVAGPLHATNDIKEEIEDAGNYLYMLWLKIDKIEQHISSRRWDELYDEEDLGETSPSNDPGDGQ